MKFDCCKHIVACRFRKKEKKELFLLMEPKWATAFFFQKQFLLRNKIERQSVYMRVTEDYAFIVFSLLTKPNEVHK